MKLTKYEKEKRPDSAFNPMWKIGQPWPSYDLIKELMTCTVYWVFKTNSHMGRNLIHKHLFITVYTNFRASTVTDHDHFKGHIDAYTIENLVKNCKSKNRFSRNSVWPPKVEFLLDLMSDRKKKCFANSASIYWLI